MLATINCPHLIKIEVKCLPKQSPPWGTTVINDHPFLVFHRMENDYRNMRHMELLRLEHTSFLCSGAGESSNLRQLTTERENDINRGVIKSPGNTGPPRSKLSGFRDHLGYSRSRDWHSGDQPRLKQINAKAFCDTALPLNVNLRSCGFLRPVPPNLSLQCTTLQATLPTSENTSPISPFPVFIHTCPTFCKPTLHPIALGCICDSPPGLPESSANSTSSTTPFWILHKHNYSLIIAFKKHVFSTLN